MLKPELYELVKLHKTKNEKYCLDELLKKHGHHVLRLPPYHPDLNPIEMVWSAVKRYVASHNTTFSFKDVEKLTTDKINSMNEKDWKPYCEKVKNIEKEYEKLEPLIDEMTERFIIHANADSETENESDSDSFSDVGELAQELDA